MTAEVSLVLPHTSINQSLSVARNGTQITRTRRFPFRTAANRKSWSKRYGGTRRTAANVPKVHDAQGVTGSSPVRPTRCKKHDVFPLQRPLFFPVAQVGSFPYSNPRPPAQVQRRPGESSWIGTAGANTVRSHQQRRVADPHAQPALPARATSIHSALVAGPIGDLNERSVGLLTVVGVAGRAEGHGGRVSVRL